MSFVNKTAKAFKEKMCTKGVGGALLVVSFALLLAYVGMTGAAITGEGVPANDDKMDPERAKLMLHVSIVLAIHGAAVICCCTGQT